MQFIYIRQQGMYFVLMTRENISPNLAVGLVTRICQLIKDYCGNLSEETIRRNIVLIYEILDEIIDYGFPQNTSTEYLKAFVLDEPFLQSEGSTSSSVCDSSCTKSLFNSDN